MANKSKKIMTNRWLYSLIAFGVLLALGIGVYAYQANMQEGDPPVMGHSAGEINVDISGTTKTLQKAIDDEDFKTEMEHVSGGFYGYCEQGYSNSHCGNPRDPAFCQNKQTNNPCQGYDSNYCVCRCPSGYTIYTIGGIEHAQGGDVFRYSCYKD